MDGVSLTLLVAASFVAGLTVKSVINFAADKLKLNKKRSQAVCKKEQTVSVQNAKSSEEEFHVLGKMGYFLASNDEDKMPAFSASPMQDVDPQDLA